MNKQEILGLIKFITPFNDAEIFSDIDITLCRRYETNMGKYDVPEIKQALFDHFPVIVQDHVIIGFDLETKMFIDHNNDLFRIERPVNAIIVTACRFQEKEKEEPVLSDVSPYGKNEGEPFAIVGTDQWPSGSNSLFFQHIEPLLCGSSFLPKHSAVFNFLNPTAETEKNGIVSKLSGVNINLYDKDRYFENMLHEIGHLFWRTQVSIEEQEQWSDCFTRKTKTAIVEFDWEFSSAEEYFCTVYMWYLRSIFIHKSFANILAHEDPGSFEFIKNIISRIGEQQAAMDTFNLAKPEIDAFFNPVFDVTTRQFIRKKGLLEQIKGIDIPDEVLTDVEGMTDGTVFVNLTKATRGVPVKKNRIDFSKIGWKDLEKSRSLTNGKPVIFVDMDGVVADFNAGYKAISGRDCRKDDLFTVQQQCMTQPRFFRNLPVIEKGRDLVKKLSEDYTVAFLTAPMECMEYCKADKLSWAQRNFPDVKTIIFSTDKAQYAGNDHAILIDDMSYNLEPFAEAGGTAIDSAIRNEKIIEKVKEAFEQPEEITEMKAQLNGMDVDLNPSEEEKESGNYKKGDIVYKGMNIKIENPKGSIRFGFDQTGQKWINRMKAHYGYIVGPEGNDGDHIDCFIGNKFNGNRVFVVNQKDPKSGLFDEHKIMLCYDNIEDAQEGYLANYQKGWDGILSIATTNTKKLREWLLTGNKTEPFGSAAVEQGVPIPE